MRKFLFFIVPLSALIAFVILSASEGSPGRQDGSSVSFPSGTVIVVEIADDEFERVQGLSDREMLEEGTGLLFFHDRSDYQRYWMKDMNFPIDIIWIDGDEVVGFVEAAQPEEPPLTIYTSPAPVDKVLEVSSGFVAENGIKIGDILDIELPDE